MTHPVLGPVLVPPDRSGVRPETVAGRPRAGKRELGAPAAEEVPPAERVVAHRGLFVLVRSGEGFAWTVPGPEGEPWYWHPDESQWTARPCASPSPERASAGFNPDALHAASGNGR